MTPIPPSEILALENHGRPSVQVWGTEAMVSSMHPEATHAALDVLKTGGNAIDAALALGATISVVSPEWSGLGGDSAWLIYSAETGESFHLDGYSTCPTRLSVKLLEQRFDLSPERTPEAYCEEPGECRGTGVIVSMVPGTPSAWVSAWERFGSLPLPTLFARAVHLAEKGFPISRFLARGLHRSEAKLAQFDSSRAIFFRPAGGVLGEGERLVQAELGATLKCLAEAGRAGFYGGQTAGAILAYSTRRGGVYTADDLVRYEASWRPTYRGSYRGYEVVVPGPPTAGVHLIAALNIVETFPMARLQYHSAESLHILIEALKLARADRRRYAGDPDVLDIPVRRLLDKEHARQQARLIKARTAVSRLNASRSHRDSTTHFAVRDRMGNIVSGTQTIGGEFGCGEVVEGTGILMNDRTWWMALQDGPNVVSPGRRANIGHAPAILLDSDGPFMALGSPGGDGILQYVVQVIVNVIDYGLDIQEAIESPRFRSEDLDRRVGVERRIASDVRDALRAWGHDVVEYPEWTERVGGVEGFWLDRRRGTILGGYDPRRNSLAGGLS